MRRSTNKGVGRHLLLVLLLLVCGGLTRLGVWQLHRAAEKHTRFAAFVERHQAPAIDFDTTASRTSLAETLWRKAHIRGHFLELYVLLDNRVLHGRPGYEVLTPFATHDGRVVLVDRGWIPLPSDRNTLPEVLAPSDPTTLTGYIGAEPTVGISLGKTAVEAEIMAPGLFRVQRVDLEGIRSLLHLPLSDRVIYLDADALGALAVDWPVPGDGSARNRAYAVQWFTLAAVLAGIGFWNLYGRRRA